MVGFDACFFFVGCGKEPTLIQDHQEVSIPQSEKSKAYYQYLLGEHAVLRGFYGDAIEYFNHADKIASSTAIEYRIAVEHARHMRFRESFDVIDRILEKEPQHFYAKLLRAKIYATEGNYIDSKQDFKDVLADPQMEADPQEKVRTQLSLVTLQIEAKDFVAARKLLAKMEKEDPQNELVYYYQARILTEQGRLQEAQRLFEKTVQINDQFSLAHRALVLMYEYHDQEAKKIATLEKIVALQPTDIQVRTQLIRIYIAKGQLNRPKNTVFCQPF
ncbi:MAG: tetratricopeptide repeat protein [Bdellovibrionota bacterium]